MSAKPAPQVDSPEVDVFCKKARGEPSPKRSKRLAPTYRKPEGAARGPVSQAKMASICGFGRASPAGQCSREPR